jgi:HEAT repeat protein
LRRIGRDDRAATTALIGVLNDADADEALRCAAADALGDMKAPAELVVPVLIKRLRDEKTSVCEAAAGALQHIGPEAEAAVPALLGVLKEKRETGPGHSTAVYALAGIGKPAVPALIETLRGKDPVSRPYVAEALGLIGPDAKAAAPLLVDMMKEDDAYIRCSAASALGGVRARSKEAVAALIAAVDDKDETVNHNAVSALAAIGPAAKEAVPVLLRKLKRADWVPGSPLPRPVFFDSPGPFSTNAGRGQEWRKATEVELIADAIAAIGPDAVPALLEGLKDKEGVVRASCARVLSRIGPDAKAAVPALIRTLREPKEDPLVRECVAEALGSIGPAAREAADALHELLDDEDDCSRAAAFALVAVGADAKAAVPELRRALKDVADFGLQQAPDAEATAGLRVRAALALSLIGPDAKAATPELLALLKDRSVRVREAAAFALRKIDPDAAKAAGY